jgi:hypothetical protein
MNGSSYDRIQHVFDQFSRYNMKILLGCFNAKLECEDIFKPTVGMKSFHKNSGSNNFRILNFATSKNLIIKSKMLCH